MAVDLMRSSLSIKIERETFSDDLSKKVARSLIDKCIVTPPITTISMAAGDKYHGYYAGSEGGELPAGNPFRVLPLFAAEVVLLPQIKPYSNPVYVLGGFTNSISNLGIGSPDQLPAKKIAVLYRDIEESGISPYPMGLPQEVVLSGWKTGLVDSSVKTAYQKEISIFYHPFTLAIFADGTRSKPVFEGDIIGFINSHTKYNSTNGFHFGPQTTRSGALIQYPPVYASSAGSSHIGILLPMKYPEGTKDIKQSVIKIAPLFDARIPIELPTDSPGHTVRVDVSDFLMRDPPEAATRILSDISRYYLDYKRETSQVKGVEKARKIKENYQKIITTLFEQYRNLPYKVMTTKSSTTVEYHGITGERSASPASSFYIPMADYVTCNKILSYEEFSPEFGGHSLWDAGDSDGRAVVKGALEQMLIDSNNLDYLAELMTRDLKGTMNIDARDLLDPHRGVFRKLYQKAMEEAGDKEPSLVAASLIKKITAYNVGEDYSPDEPEHRYATFWDNAPPEAMQACQNIVTKNRRDWVSSLGPSYLISSANNGQTDQPGARIKVMNEMFPFNAGTSLRVNELQAVQDPHSKEIIAQSNFYASKFLYGQLHSGETYLPLKSVAEEGAEFTKGLKKLQDQPSLTLSAVKYARGISNLFTDYIVASLTDRIIVEKGRKDIEADVRPISKKAGLNFLKISKVRVASLATMDTIGKAGIASLLSMFTK